MVSSLLIQRDNRGVYLERRKTQGLPVRDNLRLTILWFSLANCRFPRGVGAVKAGRRPPRSGLALIAREPCGPFPAARDSLGVLVGHYRCDETDPGLFPGR